LKTGSRLFVSFCLFFAATITACQQAQKGDEQSASKSVTNLRAIDKGVVQKNSQSWVTLDPYKFRLVPDFHSDGQSRLEIYICDAEDIPVSGATGALHVTNVHGPEGILTLVEAYHSYYAAADLDDKGQYEVSAQIMIFGKKYSPHFSFSR